MGPAMTVSHLCVYKENMIINRNGEKTLRGTDHVLSVGFHYYTDLHVAGVFYKIQLPSAIT